MSVLETPRIYFKGEISWDPITTNNNWQNYSESSGDPVWPPDPRQIIVPAPEKVKAFRAEAIKCVANPAYESWNPHGTHRSSLYNTTVCGFDVGNGLETGDPIVSIPVNLTGMLVDLDPYSGFTSQIFFDHMTFGVDGGYRILARRSARFADRYANFGRGPRPFYHAGAASVIWQTSCAQTDGLKIDAFDSAVLQALETALQQDDVLGLTVRINSYRTIYYDDPNVTNGSAEAHEAAERLTAKLNGGGFQPNPAKSLVVGAIGLWRKGEPASEPGDRVLVQVGGSPVATSFARFSGSNLVLDLSNSVPEELMLGVPTPILEKKNLGPLTVVAVDPRTRLSTSIGTIEYSQYDEQAYGASAGIVTLPVTGDPARFAGQDLELRDGSGGALLREQTRRLVPSSPNLYVQEGETVSTCFQLYERGVPAATNLPLTLFRLDPNLEVVGSSLQVTNDGILSLAIEGDAGQVYLLVPSFGEADNPQLQNFTPQMNTYMYVRVQPADVSIAQLPATWKNVYAYVLANWNAMAPCMDNWLKLDDPVQVRAYGALLKKLTDPAHFEWYRFMPVTRDMSAGERALLYRFLDSPAEPEESDPAAEGARPDFAQLGRSMRGPA